MSNKLNLEIIYKLPANLMPINSPKASVLLINSYILFNLINYFFIANKQSPFLKDKRAKAIKSN
jgi:hypothetical protein